MVKRFTMWSLVGAFALVASPLVAQDMASMPDVPPNAQPGECYAQVTIPAQFDTKTERVVKREAGERIEVTPARFEWVTKRVMVQDEHEGLRGAKGRVWGTGGSSDPARHTLAYYEQTGGFIPAQYRTVTEEVVIEPASFKLIEVPAEYDTVQERVMVKPARQVWKKNSGRVYGSQVSDATGKPITKMGNTGEVMCLVEEPAEYKTVSKRVLKSPAQTRRVEIPAKTKTMQRKVMVSPPRLVLEKIPAKYEEVRVKQLVEPAKERRIPIPAEYDTITQRVMVEEAQVMWASVLCEVNMTQPRILALQRALSRAGYNPGPVDGVIGDRTMVAIEQYQRANQLATGGLTYQTLQSLGVNM